ncbi:MAG: VapC toxin family PIN domain ribonuclease [Gammaproteobacteria bacterium]|nr:MAG: VapC toxin family PIN domain ribonuclease [Gammaproteobacteria bacterium]
MYLLDTNACIQLLNKRDTQIEKNIQNVSPSEIVVCSVVKAELIYGARHSARVEENLQLLSQFFAPMQSFSFDDKAAEEYGVIRSDLSSQGKAIGPNDLLIASIARSRDLTLVSNNTKEFARITGLRLVDWQ